MRIYLLIFIFLLVSAEFCSGHYYDCPVEMCRKDGPMIRFPFRLKDRHPKHCGYTGFDLYCSHQNNDTVLELPFAAKTSIDESMLPDSVKFIVEEIDYLHQFITLSKINACLPRLLPELNLSASPFRLKDPDDYTFFNCSSTRTNSSYYMIPVSCLSSSNYHVYAVDTFESLYGGYAYGSRYYYDEPFYVTPLFFCSKMFNMSLASSTLFYDIIPLNWPEPACGHCEIKGKHCRPKKKGSINDTVCLPRMLHRGQ